MTDLLFSYFTKNPEINKSKIDVIMAKPAAGDTIISIRSKYQENDVIFI